MVISPPPIILDDWTFFRNLKLKRGARIKLYNLKIPPKNQIVVTKFPRYNLEEVFM